MRIVVGGMYGMGDCIHQRAILRDMMDAGCDVTLETYYASMYHDLVERGLRLRLASTSHSPRVRDPLHSTLAAPARGLRQPEGRRVRLSYDGLRVLRHGSILAAQYASVGMTMPERPDFLMPVPMAWRTLAHHRLPDACVRRPIMVYRPITLNNVWRSEARSPDAGTYARLYEFIRDEFFTVSVANLGDRGERIDGPEMDADVKFHAGELDFQELAGLFAEARVSMTCPGFAPVLSQAVGTPTIIVYGGNESFRTTNSVGAHLASTLAIEPVHPCECHLKDHDCDKTVDVPQAIDRLFGFTRQFVQERVPA